MILFFTILITTVLMEGVAWGMHKYLMHGFFWNLHEDHHLRTNHDSFFERNDTFFYLLLCTFNCRISDLEIY